MKGSRYSFDRAESDNMEPAVVTAVAPSGAAVDLWSLKYRQLKSEFKLLQEDTLVLAQEYEQAAASFCYEKECHEYVTGQTRFRMWL